MGIEKVKDGWLYDGLLFVKKKDAEAAMKASEQEQSLPEGFEEDREKKIHLLYDDEDARSFGFFVFQFLKKHKGKKTIKAVAQEIGVSKQTFFKWINGESMPSAKHCRDIKRVMKCGNPELFRALRTNSQAQMAKVLDVEVAEVKVFEKAMTKKISG